MATVCCSYKFITTTSTDNNNYCTSSSSALAYRSNTNSGPPLLHKFPPPLSSSPRRGRGRRSKRVGVVVLAQSSSWSELSSTSKDEWLKKLPDKKKALYAHSLPCIEAWLKSLGFYQNKDDRALWFVEKPDWHAQLSLDLTDLYIRYLKTGPGNLEKDIERRFSYALSREDIENAMLGGP